MKALPWSENHICHHMHSWLPTAAPLVQVWIGLVMMCNFGGRSYSISSSPSSSYPQSVAMEMYCPHSAQSMQG